MSSLLELAVFNGAFTTLRVQVLTGLAYSALFGAVTVGYIHLIDKALDAMYKAGHLKRFFAQPKDRFEEVAFMDAFLFAIPAIMYLVIRETPLSFSFNLVSIYSHLIFYMLLHDTWFYSMHLEAHRWKLWMWDQAIGTYRHCDLPAFAYGEGPWEKETVEREAASTVEGAKSK
ncbi:hypothetical protein HDU83_004362 [Entophlyctis luteolus]|nr:hypothetical protein HDU83_004362 [Entophlyctis luteolus]